MKIQETVSVNADGKEYKISKDVWDKYVQMHPIRTDESLEHDVSKFIIYDGESVTPSKIEEIIMEEYNYISKMDFPNMISEARKLYEESIQYED